MRLILNFLLLVFVFISCETKKVDELKESTIVVKDSVVKENKVDEIKTSDCMTRLIDIVQSNSKCKELIGYMKNQNVKYGFQIDSFPVLSRTYPQDSLMYYELTLIEHHSTHNRNAAQFSFSPYFKRLSIMDSVKNKFIETDCDMKLIDSYKKNCWN